MQNQEIGALSGLLERHQAILEKVANTPNPVPEEVPLPQEPTFQLQVLQGETFNVMSGTISAKGGQSVTIKECQLLAEHYLKMSW